MLSKFRQVLIISLALLLPVIAPQVLTGTSDEDDEKDEFVNHALLEGCKPMGDFLAEGDAAAAAGDVEGAIREYHAALEAALDIAPNAMYRIEAAGAVLANVEMYRSGLELCRSRLMKMNAADLVLYRRLFDPKAARELRKAVADTDPEALMDIGERYAFASGGLRAIEMAGDIFAENDNATMAAYCYERALEVCGRWPSAAPQGKYALVLGKVAAAYCEIGDGERLGEIARLVRGDPKLAGAKLRLYGETVELGAFVTAKAKSFKPRVVPPVSGYPAFGGNAAGNALMGGLAGRPGGEVWRYTIEDSLKSLLSNYRPEEVHTRPLLVSTFPAACDGRLYINTGSALIALDEYDGSKAFRTVFHKGAPDKYYISSPLLPSFCTVSDGVAYALQQQGRLSRRSPVLMAVSTAGGKVLWRSDRLTRGAEEFRGTCLITGPVTVSGGRLYVVVRSRQGGPWRDYLVCADAKTGERLWYCFLCENRGDNRLHRAAQLPDYVVIDGGTAVVAVPSSGLMAAVDLRRGRLTWAVTYNEDQYLKLIMPHNIKDGDSLSPRIFNVSHPIIQNGRVVYAPRNSSGIFCFDVRTGEARWTLAALDLRYIVGVDGNELFYFGKNLNVVDIATGVVTALDVRYSGEIVGRPALTEDSIYFSTTTGLYRYDRNRKAPEVVMGWQRGRTFPGNLIALESTLYVVNSEQVIALSGAGLLMKYNDLIEKNDTDPVLRLKRARARVADTDFKGALEDLKVAEKYAADGMTAFGRPLKGLIEQYFTDCYRGLMDYYFARQKYDKALEYAGLSLKHAGSQGIAAQVLLRMAEIYERRADGQSIREAIGVYCEMIAAEEMMLEFPNSLNNLKVSSRFYAAARITDLIKKHGRAAYAAQETKAAAALAKIGAGTAGKGREGLGLYYEYPNSLAALKGLTQLARESEKRGEASRALMLCKIAMRNYEDQPALVPVLEMAQRLAWRFGETSGARHALERLAGISGALMSDGRTAAEFARARLDEIETQAETAKGRPPLDPDAKLVQKVELDDSAPYRNGARYGYSTSYTKNVVLPVRGRRPECMVGKVLIRRGSMVECYDLSTGRELWYNSMTRAWLGFDFWESGGNRCNIWMSAEACEKGLANGAGIVSVAGRTINNYGDVEEAIKDRAIGEKIEVVYRPRDPKNYPRQLPSKKTIMLTLSKPPAVRTSSIRWGYYSGDTVVICAKSNKITGRSREPDRIYAIDLKTGKTLWVKPGYFYQHWNEDAGRFAANNLLPLVEKKAGGSFAVFVDCADGDIKFRCALPADDKYAYLAHAGDALITIHGRREVCEVYDVLTGKLRMSMTLGQGAGSEFNVAAERLLGVSDNGGVTHVIDLFTGRVIFSRPGGGAGRFVQRHASERYMVISHGGGSQPAVLFDGATATRTEIPLKDYYGRVFVRDDRVLFLRKPRNSGLIVTMYDIKTGKIEWSKTTSFTGHTHSAEVQGDYLRIFDMKYVRRTVGRSAEGVLYEHYTQIEIFVMDVKTGEEVIMRGLTHEGRIERNGGIIDGRLCVVLGKYLYVYNKPPGGE